MACHTIGVGRSSLCYKPKRQDKEQRLIKELHRLKAAHPRCGYKKIDRLLRNGGWKVNHKRVQRLLRQDGLTVIGQPPKTKLAIGNKSNGCDVRRARSVNHVWSVNFVEDRTEYKRRLKILTVIDEYSRESLAVCVRRKMGHKGVQEVIEELVGERGRPELIRSDNGSEFIAKGLQRAVKEMGSQCLYIAPGSSWQNGKNERFNVSLRQELLQRELFY